jgi:hypothetical protein
VRDCGCWCSAAAGSPGVAEPLRRSRISAHWTWVVLTAFIVCSGTRGRTDLLRKGVLGAAGAALAPRGAAR